MIPEKNKMEKEINIKRVTRKTSANNKNFIVLETDQGKMGCWNAALFDKLIAGKFLSVEIEEKNGYTNVMSVNAELGFSKIKPEEKYEHEARNEVSNDRTAGMLVSYAKDLVIAGKMEFLDLAAEAVILAYRKIREAINAADNGKRPTDFESADKV